MDVGVANHSPWVEDSTLCRRWDGMLVTRMANSLEAINCLSIELRLVQIIPEV